MTRAFYPVIWTWVKYSAYIACIWKILTDLKDMLQEDKYTLIIFFNFFYFSSGCYRCIPEIREGCALIGKHIYYSLCLVNSNYSQFALLYHIIEQKFKVDNLQLHWFPFCSLGIFQYDRAGGKCHFLNNLLFQCCNCQR